MGELVPLVDLCRQLQTQAKAHGVFVDDRELIDCPCCGLFEDVTAEGLLIISRELVTPPIDTGLRFCEVSPNTFQCPACAEAIKLNEEADGEED